MTNGESPKHDLKERTKALALRVVRMYPRLPKTTAAQILGKQVLRSGTSGANHREAGEGRSKAEFVAKMGDCLRELSETEYWLELLIDAGMAKSATMSPLLIEARELKANFSTIIRRARSA